MHNWACIRLKSCIIGRNVNTEHGIMSSKLASQNAQTMPLVTELLLLTPLNMAKNNNRALGVLTHVAHSQSQLCI